MAKEVIPAALIVPPLDPEMRLLIHTMENEAGAA
jgi:hypothetical protein